MSTPLAGKFQDHYAVLGVESRADSDTIHRAYSALAAKYHPNNHATADKEKFAAVTQAYEILADPATRKAFDEVRAGPEHDAPPQFSGPKFFESIVHEAARRQALLCLLYDRRQQKPFSPSLAMRQLEAMLTPSLEELTFTIWYLKQRGLIKSDDKSSLQITVEGMEHLERDLPSMERVQPFLKPYDPAATVRKPSVASFPASPPKPATVASTAQGSPAQSAASGWRLPQTQRASVLPKRG